MELSLSDCGLLSLVERPASEAGAEKATFCDVLAIIVHRVFTAKRQCLNGGSILRDTLARFVLLLEQRHVEQRHEESVVNKSIIVACPFRYRQSTPE